MTVGLMEIVRSVNRSWIYDTQFSLYRAFHPGGKSGGGKCPGELSEYHLYLFLTCTYRILLITCGFVLHVVFVNEYGICSVHLVYGLYLGIRSLEPNAPYIVAEECRSENNTVTVVWSPAHDGNTASGYVLELDDGNKGNFRVRIHQKLFLLSVHQQSNNWLLLFLQQTITITKTIKGVGTNTSTIT